MQQIIVVLIALLFELVCLALFGLLRSSAKNKRIQAHLKATKGSASGSEPPAQRSSSPDQPR